MRRLNSVCAQTAMVLATAAPASAGNASVSARDTALWQAAAEHATANMARRERLMRTVPEPEAEPSESE